MSSTPTINERATQVPTAAKDATRRINSAGAQA